MLKPKPSMRHIILSVFFAVLILSAGCSSVLTDRNSSPPTTPTQEVTAGSDGNSTNNTISANGTDLRNISIPDEGENSNVAEGEVDGGDSVFDGTNRYYEPIRFTADAGDSINVSLQAESDDIEFHLRSPNGSTIAVENHDDGSDSIQIEMLELNRSGQYTLVVAATEPNTSFEYTLTMERYVEPDFQGELSEWDEESRYLSFADDYLLFAQYFSGGPAQYEYPETPEEADGNLTATHYTVNTEEDYVVVEYMLDPDATTLEMINVDTAVQDAYARVYGEYLSNSTTQNTTWVPDRVYHRVRTYEGELYRTTYLDREWAVDFYENDGLDNTTAQVIYANRYWSTIRQGPAHPEYEPGSEVATTDNGWEPDEIGEEMEERYENTTSNATD